MNILKNDKVGRYGVAKNNFNPGDEIFPEVPFAFGPKIDSPPLCLGCYKPTNQNFCSKCSWPVCSKRCEKTPAHKNAECEIFSNARVRFQKEQHFLTPCLQYECITPLRVLLAIKSSPERWDSEVKIMEAHNHLRKTQPIWHFNQINIINYLRGPCKLAKHFTEETIHTVCGILETNAFEARSASGYPIRCLYPKLAILSHNCISNINHSIVCNELGDENDFRVTARASIKIQEGDELFSSYAYSIWPTMTRRNFLKESKHFDCSCLRCSDPTELGTHMSTLLCDSCTNGFITSLGPLDSQANWMCNQCKKVKSSNEVQNLLERIQNEIDSTEGNLRDKFECLVSKYRSILHSCHSLNCQLYLSLIDLYETSPNDERLTEKRVKYCEIVLGVLNVIEPGFSRIRGIILYKLCLSLLSTKDITPVILNKAKKILEESVSILKLEAPSNIEGKIGVMASNMLSYLQDNICDITNHIMPIKVLLSNHHSHSKPNLIRQKKGFTSK